MVVCACSWYLLQFYDNYTTSTTPGHTNARDNYCFRHCARQFCPTLILLCPLSKDRRWAMPTCRYGVAISRKLLLAWRLLILERSRILRPSRRGVTKRAPSPLCHQLPGLASLIIRMAALAAAVPQHLG
eukprot:COSAG01_NODE_7627_length_3131_cov_1.850149_4_plen_129_part_00